MTRKTEMLIFENKYIKILTMVVKTEDELIDELIDLSFAEDIGDGDHTTFAAYQPTKWARANCW